jgi:hypothetical protein
MDDRTGGRVLTAAELIHSHDPQPDPLLYPTHHNRQAGIAAGTALHRTHRGHMGYDKSAQGLRPLRAQGTGTWTGLVRAEHGIGGNLLIRRNTPKLNVFSGRRAGITGFVPLTVLTAPVIRNGGFSKTPSSVQRNISSSQGVTLATSAI